MARQKEERLTITEAAKELGVSRASLYSRVKRSHDRGEKTPFVPDDTPGGTLVAPKKALLTWAATEKPAKKPATRRTTIRRRKHIPSSRETLVTPQMPSSQADFTPESVSPLATSTESTTAKALEPLLPKPTTGAPVLEWLPESYADNRLTILPRDPSMLVVFWDVNPETARQYEGSRWALKVRSDAGERVIEVQGGAKNWYLRGFHLSQSLEVLFGPMDEYGNVTPVARSVWHSAARQDNGMQWGMGVRDTNGIHLELVAAPTLGISPGISPAASAALRGSGYVGATPSSPAAMPSSPGVGNWSIQR